MKIVLVGRKDGARIVRWSRVVPLAVVVWLAVGLWAGLLYRLLSGHWDPLPSLFVGGMGLVTVATGVITGLKTPLERLTDVE